MRRITILIILLLSCMGVLFAQAPEKFTYQAVVRNSNNQLVVNTQVGVQVVILRGSAQGSIVYGERHTQGTNANGLITLNIGEGNIIAGQFSNIDWSSGVFFISVGIDPVGGTDYTIWSTQQLLSVPYALYAKEAGNGFSGNYNDLTNLPQIPQIPINVSVFNNDAGYITMDSIPPIPTIPSNVSAFANDVGYITMDSVPPIPTIPTNVSAFNNDAGYLQSYTETDPQYNAWNKDYNDLINKPAIPTVPTNVGAFANDAGYITMDSVPQIPTNVSAFTNDAGYLQSFTETQNLANVTALGNSAGNRQLKDVADPTDSYDAVNLRSLTLVMDSAQAIIQQMQLQLSQSQQQWQIQQQQIQQQWQETQQQWQIQQMQLQQQIDSLTLILNAMAADTAFTQWNTSVVNETACNTYEWHNQTYTQSGVYLYGFTNTDGSNNVEALNLTIVTSDTTHLQEEACESYILNNTTYTESGDYYLFLTNQSGCDSVVFLHLTVHQCTHNVVTDTACETYTWHNVTYDESGVYTYAYTNEYGCASADTLHLTVYHGTHNVVTDTVCESYIWHDSTYTESGVYTYAYTNEHGCASVDTLKLTVHYGTHNLTDENACGSYEWHGQTYTESGTYSYIYSNEYGCPSEDTLKVVVVAVDAKSCSAAPCVTDIDGNMYRTVQIGDQCWMRSNLRVTHFPDGSAIPAGNTTSDTSPFYYNTPNSYYSLEHRGYLYNWPAVMHNQSSSTTDPSGVQGICPDGWHVPSDAEWAQLIAYVSSQSAFGCEGNNAYYAKALALQTGWSAYSYPSTCVVGNNQSQNNATGFSAVPAGQYYGSYVGESSNAIFWTSSENSSSAYHYKLWEGSTILERTSAMKSYGFSVRCVLDAGSHRVESASACGSYEWHGQTYTESGIYTHSYNNAINLPSTDTLKLTVYHGTHNVEADTACETFTWHETSYTESGTYTYAYTDDNGCASVDTLILTIFQGCTIDEKSCPGTPLLTDVDGNTYGTVQIGEQCWMRSNLRTLHYADGTAVPAGDTAHSETDPFYYDYESCFTLPERGYYYNWPAVMHSQPASCTNPSDVQGICPDGWHVPSDREWIQMIDYLADKSEYYCDRFSYLSSASLASDTGWTYNNSYQCAPGDHISHNATGFTAIPAGFYQLASRLDTWYISYGLGGGDCTQGAYFWCSTENSADKAYYRAILNSSYNVSTSNVSKDVGFSVRCIMNTETETDTIDEKSCPGTPSVTDIDGNTYATVQIGDQCWMRSNLRTTRYADGTAVPAGNMNFSKTEPYYYDFSSQGGDGISQFFPLSKRGYLYNWAAAMHGAASSNTNPSQVQGVCPNGWHVPSNEEWTQLENYVRSQSQYVCGGGLGNTSGIAKALTSTTGWKSYHGNICNPCYNPSSNNATGFNAMPVGSYDYNGGLGGTELTWFLSSTENDSTSIHYCMLWYNGHYLGRFTEPKDKGFSVRCLRNENGSVPPPPSDCSSYHISISGGTVLCRGESATLTASEASNYSWSNGSNTVSINVSPTATTTYSVTGTDSQGCVDSASVTVVVNPAAGTSISVSTCNSYEWHGQTYNQSNTYTYAYNNEYGCAVADTLHLTIKPIIHNIETQTACESYTWHGQTYNQSGTYTYAYTGDNGCPGVDTLHLTINHGSHNVITETVCESYTWHGTTYEESGQHVHHYTNTSGCPSTTTLFLTIHNGTHTDLYDTGCNSYTWHGQPYTSSGTYTHTYQNSDGCTNVETLHLTILSSAHNVENVDTCDQYVWHGTTYYESGTKTYSYTTGDGCSGVDTLHLTIHEPVYVDAYAEACDSFVWNGIKYTESDEIEQIFTTPYGCDSVVTLHLTIYNGTHNGFTDTTEGPYTWHGQTYFESGTYLHIDTNANGCPSVDTLYLTVITTDTIYDNTGCPGMPIVMDHEGNVYNTVQIGGMCWTKENMRCATSPITGDSLITEWSAYTGKAASWHPDNVLHDPAYGLLYNWCAAMDTFYAAKNYPEIASIRDTNYFPCTFSGPRRGICPKGWHVSSTAEWRQMLNFVHDNGDQCAGCSRYEWLFDEDVECIAKALSSTTGWEIDNYTSCSVGNNLSANNATGFSALPAGRRYFDVYHSYEDEAYFWTDSMTITFWNDVTQDTGYVSHPYYYVIYYDDSYVAQRSGLMYHEQSVRCVRDENNCGTHHDLRVTSCDSYVWHGNTYIESGTYYYGYTNEFGCPCTERLYLTIKKGTHNVITVGDCQYYLWHGHTYDTSGTYTYEYVNEYGCASVDTLKLTIQPHVYLTFYVETENEYHWHGQTYYASGTYVYEDTNDHGCPYTDTLYLTFINGEPCPGTPIVTDVDSNIYHTVQIGNQCWMKENLRVTRRTDGTSIPYESNPDLTISLQGDEQQYLTASYWCYPNNSLVNKNTYGLLYNWPAAASGICPTGWHLPSKAEWQQMISYVSSQTEYVCGNDNDDIAKALAARAGWPESATECAVGNTPSSNNTAGLSVLPAGIYNNNYSSFGSLAFFWNSTQYNGNNNYAYGYYFTFNSASVSNIFNIKAAAASVRCLRD